MSWTTIWSHGQRGIASYNTSNGENRLMFRRIAPVKMLRFVFANDYGRQPETIQSFSVLVNEDVQRLAAFSVAPGERVKTPPVSIDPTARKWLIEFETTKGSSGFPTVDADVLAETNAPAFCAGLLAIEAEVPGTCVVALGDSLTEGATWTTPLQRTLRQQNIFLVNQGINGSCLLKAASDRPAKDSAELFYGFAALQRLRICLASHLNVRRVILSLGINDLIHGELTLETYQQSIHELIEVCKEEKIAYQLCTLTPCLGYPGMDQAKETVRRDINHWLLTHYDNVWDFSSMVEQVPGQLNPAYDSGDHLHINAIAGLVIARQISSDFVKGE